jgi:hypothetical protein
MRDGLGVGIGVIGALFGGAIASAQPVVVAVDMDGATPGVQDTITVPPGTTLVRNVSIQVFDPTASYRCGGIGYIGGIDRGLAFGHQPAEGHVIGRVASLDATLAEPAITGGMGLLTPFVIKVFDGPEIQYLETAPALGALNSDPSKRIFTVELRLSHATPGDVFSFYLADPVSMGLGPGQGGVFSSQGFLSLETGGDAVPDGTRTAYGVDPDPPAPSPPAAFEVDLRDGSVFGAGARVIIDGCYPDCDQSTGSGVLDVFDFLCFQDAFVSADPYACACDLSTGAGVCDVFDFLCFQDAFVSGCP